MKPDDEGLVSSQKSLFRTRIPRSTNMTLHLVIWGITLCGALLVAMLSAEYFSKSDRFPANSISKERSNRDSVNSQHNTNN